MICQPFPQRWGEGGSKGPVVTHSLSTDTLSMPKQSNARVCVGAPRAHSTGHPSRPRHPEEGQECQVPQPAPTVRRLPCPAASAQRTNVAPRRLGHGTTPKSQRPKCVTRTCSAVRHPRALGLTVAADGRCSQGGPCTRALGPHPDLQCLSTQTSQSSEELRQNTGPHSKAIKPQPPGCSGVSMSRSSLGGCAARVENLHLDDVG